MATAAVLHMTSRSETAYNMASQHNNFDSGPAQQGSTANDEVLSSQDDARFHPRLHLAYAHRPNVRTMSDIGLPESCGVSQVLASESFQLFAPLAVKQMRQEVLSEELRRECGYSSNTTQGQLRVGVERYAPFTYSLWNSPEMLSIISEIAQLDLEPDHINVSSKSEDDHKKDSKNSVHNDRENDEGIAGCLVEDFEEERVGEIRTRRFEPDAWKRTGTKGDQASLARTWKNDTYPFVCVTMLNDTVGSARDMILTTDLGAPIKIKEPQVGCSIILQGRRIQQQALSILSKGERIAMLTSFRPRQDKSQKLEHLEEKIKLQLDEVRDSQASGNKVDMKKLKQLLKEQTELVKRLDSEVIDDDHEFVWGDDRIGEGDEGFYW